MSEIERLYSIYGRRGRANASFEIIWMLTNDDEVFCNNYETWMGYKDGMSIDGRVLTLMETKLFLFYHLWLRDKYGHHKSHHGDLTLNPCLVKFFRTSLN